jgi:RecA/RadA recombinase
MLNIALSGKFNGGVAPGITVIAGPSKHFKSNYGLLMASSFQKKYSDGVVLFFDSEFGITPEYMQNFGIDTDRVVHIPITNLEELKFELTKQVDELEESDKVFIFLDSLGALSSKAEMENAINGKSAIDMQRSKYITSILRTNQVMLNMKKIPMVIINHTYDDIGSLWGGQVLAGGRSVMYMSDTVLIIGRSQDKNSKGNLEGWNFTINVEKSRFLKEKTKIPITVRFDKGIDRFSGLLEDGIEGGFIQKVGDSVIRTFIENDTKIYLKGKTEQEKAQWWKEVIKYEPFIEYVEKKYTLQGNILMEDEEQSEEKQSEEE